MNPLELINLYATPITAKDKNDAIALEVATNFSLRKTLLTHSRFKQAITQIAELHQHSKSNNVGGGLLVTGPSGVGKTTILQHYLDQFPRIKAQQKTIIPVLHVVTPASPTVKSFAEAILLALGDPMAQRGSAEQKTFRIYQLLEACEVEIMLIDEIQHFYYAHSIVEFRRITDWLKNMISLSGLGVVLFGLEEAEMVVFSNEQLARRFSSRLHIAAFKLTDEQDFKEFRAALKGLQEVLPIPVEAPLFEANLARRFLVASGGLLDYVRKVLEGAVVVAARAGLKQLDLQTYAAGFRNNVWPEVSDRLNPFHPESPLRPFTKPGEPFYSGEKRNAIGSPLARRNINKPQGRE